MLLENQSEIPTELLIRMQHDRLLQLKAWHKWVTSDPKLCNCETHFDKEDSQVCEREKSWRVYLKTRNGKELTKEDLFFLGAQ